MVAFRSVLLLLVFLVGCAVSVASTPPTCVALAVVQPTLQDDSDASTAVSVEQQDPDADAVSDGTLTTPSGEESESPTEASEADGHGEWHPVWQTNNRVFLFGMVMGILGLVFWTSSSEVPFFKTFYRFVPMLLLCYFLPSLLTMSGVAGSEAAGDLYFVASRFLLPACLVLLTMCVDLREVLRLGPKALIMFLAGTGGVVLGGPLAVLIVGSLQPDLISVDGADSTWRGLSTVAGSWIGGGANQTAMKVLFEPSEKLFSQMVAVDVIVAEVWMAILLVGIGHADKIDRWLKADASSIEELKRKMEDYSKANARMPTTTDLMVISAIGLSVTGVGHLLGELLAAWMGERFSWASTFSFDSGFFWLILFATLVGLVLSFTPARRLDGAGASKVATVFIFILVGTIGLQMDLWALFEKPGVFLIGGVWMALHVILMFVTAWLIRAPYFFLAVGSKANIGGAASAPVVAAAFHPSLAPVGVLLAVLGYVLGTFGAYLSAHAMRLVSGA